MTFVGLACMSRATGITKDLFADCARDQEQCGSLRRHDTLPAKRSMSHIDTATRMELFGSRSARVPTMTEIPSRVEVL